MCPTNERWRYIVTLSLIGWAHTQNDPLYMGWRGIRPHVEACNICCGCPGELLILGRFYMSSKNVMQRWIWNPIRGDTSKKGWKNNWNMKVVILMFWLWFVSWKSDILSLSTSLQHSEEHIDGLVQDCSNSIALAMELLQSCTNPLILSEIKQQLSLRRIDYW